MLYVIIHIDFNHIELAAIKFEQNPIVREEKLKTLDDVLPFYLEKLEEIAKNHNGFFALGRVS